MVKRKTLESLVWLHTPETRRTEISGGGDRFVETHDENGIVLIANLSTATTERLYDLLPAEVRKELDGILLKCRETQVSSSASRRGRRNWQAVLRLL